MLPRRAAAAAAAAGCVGGDNGDGDGAIYRRRRAVCPSVRPFLLPIGLPLHNTFTDLTGLSLNAERMCALRTIDLVLHVGCALC